MKIVFLDIDGVLNTNDTFHLPPNFEPKHRHEKHLHTLSIDIVNQLVDKHNAKVVISSTWRKLDKKFGRMSWDEKETREFDLRDFLARSGLKVEYHEDWHTPLPIRFSEAINGRPRGLEIKDWLEDHPEITQWVALDDDANGFFEDTLPHLARTNSDIGLSSKEFGVADKILSTLFFKLKSYENK